MVEFLTNERKVLEQKLLLSIKTDSIKKDDNRLGSSKRVQSSHHSNLPNPATTTTTTTTTVYTICNDSEGTDDHISTSKTKIIQYYTCKQFATQSPAECLKIINNKGFCIQCCILEPIVRSENIRMGDVSMTSFVHTHHIKQIASKNMFYYAKSPKNYNQISNYCRSMWIVLSKALDFLNLLAKSISTKLQKTNAATAEFTSCKESILMAMILSFSSTMDVATSL